jgi:K+-sensing histidine kinase KdpD
MTLTLKVVLALVLIVAGFTGGVKYHAGVTAQKELARQHSEAKLLARQADRIDAAAVKNEKAKETIRTRFITIEKEAERVIAQNPAYRDLCFDADGMRQLQAAVSEGTTAGEPAAALSPSGRSE